MPRSDSAGAGGGRADGEPAEDEQTNAERTNAERTGGERTGGERTGGERVPPHRSLLVRLLATSVLIAVCAIAATAWLTVRTTTGAIRQEQGRILADDTQLYDALVGRAATHRDWSQVDRLVEELASRTGRRIALTTRDRRTLADSDPKAPLPDRVSAVVDPLRVAPAGSTDADHIDPRVIGPYRLTADGRAKLRSAADRIEACLKRYGAPATRTDQPSGRPVFRIGNDDAIGYKIIVLCPTVELDTPTETERRALDRLNALVAKCLRDRHEPPVGVGLDFIATTSTAQDCVDTARREQLTPYVAPPALLFIGDAQAPAAAAVGLDLSPANTTRIAGVTGLVLVLTVCSTVLVGRRLVRPLRALTAAARGPGDRHARVPVTTNDEIGRLAAAFNDLSARRERAEEQRRAMVSDIAHELRSPLNNIRVWLEAAEDGVAEPDDDFTTSLLEEALQLQHLIDDLQDLAAADAGVLRLHREDVFVRDLLQQVATAHRAAADSAGVTLTVRTEDDPQLYADPVRIRQMIGNLVSNAVRHTAARGSVEVSAVRAETGVRIEVSDTGHGIEPEELPYVFDRFWRAEKSRSRSTGGSGLGLAIVRQLTHAHDGAVAVHSTPGAGTVFGVTLPVVPADRRRS
ncbi:HAMP domain-containing sensor histidine kinase [Streptomyces sp. NPDC050982]|uniref:HAMP domain-containing sensor histidine kinase n=1 Tax=Streptomyces sp. NPDC050982 TaxID=3154746 RepID=UPI0033CCD285